ANDNGGIEFANVLFGPGGLVKKGFGVLGLTATNTYEGGTDIQEGTVFVGRDNALGKGLLKLRGGELAVFGDATRLPNRFEVSGGKTAPGKEFTFAGAGTLLAGGTLTVESLAEGPFSGSVVFSGPLGGEGALKKIGSGQVIFSGEAANTYTGTTTVNEGTLVLSKPDGVNAITGRLVIGDREGDPETAVGSLG